MRAQSGRRSAEKPRHCRLLRTRRERPRRCRAAEQRVALRIHCGNPIACRQNGELHAPRISAGSASRAGKGQAQPLMATEAPHEAASAPSSGFR